MKITEYLCCVLTCMCLLKVANTEVSKDKNSLLQLERQLLDALTSEKTVKPKRPFCNAFTGCGRFFPDEKRSFVITRRDSQDFQATSNSVRLPISLYKALLNAAKENTWNKIGREENNYRLQQMPQAYLLDRVPLRDTLES
ncbi:cardioactive peptide-like [Ooceraea biroi]|uniref:cardioactive peptide-like n=1 Tax=Ooceraea biroi TaxID=2015173 RepID=UPI000F08EE49|nr:cardioactive peptide-like [Ooceraea biroi]